MAADVQGFMRAVMEKEEVQPFLSALELPAGASEIVFDPDNQKILSYLENYSREKALPDKEFASLKRSIEGTSLPPFQTYLPRSLVGRGISSPIFATDVAFVEYRTLAAFESALVDHEGQHTRDARDGLVIGGELLDHTKLGLISERSERCIFEVRAYMNQIKMAPERGLQGTRYQSRMWNEFLNFYFLLTDMTEPHLSPFEHYIVNSTIVGCNVFKRAYATID